MDDSANDSIDSHTHINLPLKKGSLTTNIPAYIHVHRHRYKHVAYRLLLVMIGIIVDGAGIHSDLTKNVQSRIKRIGAGHIIAAVAAGFISRTAACSVFGVATFRLTMFGATAFTATATLTTRQMSTTTVTAMAIIGGTRAGRFS